MLSKCLARFESPAQDAGTAKPGHPEYVSFSGIRLASHVQPGPLAFLAFRANTPIQHRTYDEEDGGLWLSFMDVGDAIVAARYLVSVPREFPYPMLTHDGLQAPNVSG